MSRGELHLLRYVPVSTPVHRLWAGTKLASLGMLSVAISVRPRWAGEAVLAGVILLAFALSRVPRSAFPRLPRWFWIGFGIYGALSALAGGPPSVQFGETVVDVGGALEWTRFVLLIALLAFGAAIVGWTTRLGDVAPAIRTLGAPLRLLRLPVDEAAVAIGLAVRCLPLVLDEIRTVDAARRVRRSQVPQGLRAKVRDTHDLLVTALVASVRRAREMAEAIEARGGTGAMPRAPVRLRAGDVVALGVAIVASVAILVL